MASRQYMHKCKQCNKQTMHLGPSTSHLLHLLLSIVTVGIWVIPWIIISASNASQGQCSVCGKTKTLFL